MKMHADFIGAAAAEALGQKMYKIHKDDCEQYVDAFERFDSEFEIAKASKLG
jgi:hypothetical protein